MPFYPAQRGGGGNAGLMWNIYSDLWGPGKKQRGVDNDLRAQANTRANEANMREAELFPHQLEQVKTASAEKAREAARGQALDKIGQAPRAQLPNLPFVPTEAINQGLAKTTTDALEALKTTPFAQLSPESQAFVQSAARNVFPDLNEADAAVNWDRIVGARTGNAGILPQAVTSEGGRVSTQSVPAWKVDEEKSKAARSNMDALTKAGQGLFQDLQGQPMIRTYFESSKAVDTLGKAVEVAKTNPNGVDDVQIIYNYIRALDPSVVKEGEIRLLAETSPLLSRLGIKLDSLTTGQKLNQKQRDLILTAAKRGLESHATAAQKVADSYVKQAEAQGIPSGSVAFPQFGSPKVQDPTTLVTPPGAPPAQAPNEVPFFNSEAEAEAANLPPGTVVSYYDPVKGRNVRARWHGPAQAAPAAPTPPPFQAWPPQFTLPSAPQNPAQPGFQLPDINLPLILSR